MSGKQKFGLLLALAAAAILTVLVPPAFFVSQFDGKEIAVFDFVWNPIMAKAGSTVGSGYSAVSVVSRLLYGFLIYMLPILALLAFFSFRTGSKIVNGLVKVMAVLVFLAWGFITLVAVAGADVLVLFGQSSDPDYDGRELGRMLEEVEKQLKKESAQ